MTGLTGIRRCAVFCGLLLIVAGPTAGNDQINDLEPDHAAKRSKGLEVFRETVRDVLREKCLSCHGGTTTEAKLDLGTREGLLKGGERGQAAVVGRGEKSLIVRVVSHDQEPKMPKDERPLASSQIQAIVKWINLGAPYDEPLVAHKIDSSDWTKREISADAKKHWSFQPLRQKTPPKAIDARHWSAGVIDQFILTKMNAASVYPNQPVDRFTLLRRLSMDLIGLPPTVEELKSFAADTRPDAVERVTDQLLANPHYGERWGRHWLDLVRFAESHGFEHDYDRASAFHYRDFVIQAFNDDMPYDQFVRWQVAGDEIAPDNRLAMMATGFLAAGVHATQITKNEVEKHRYDEMDDMLSTMSTSFLGLTVGCARCHDHKFDAIPQADYYRMLSIFTKTVRSEVELDFDPEGHRRALSAFQLAHAPFEQAQANFEIEQLQSRYVAWQALRDPEQDQNAWLVPRTVDYQSEGKASFVKQPDESWIVIGANPDHDIWTATVETQLTDIRSIRLEALADPSLPRSGPGRAVNGNFALSGFRADVHPAGEPSAKSCVRFHNAMATFEQNGFPVAAALDDDPQSAWAVDPEFGKDHAAVFSTLEPLGFSRGTVITVTLKFQSNAQHSIGRVRLTLSRQANAEASVGGIVSETIQSLVNRPFAELTREQQREVLDWYKRIDDEWKKLAERRAAHAELAPKPRIQKVLVASEGFPAIKLHTQAEAEFLEQTHFLNRGETHQKLSVASPGYLQVLMDCRDCSEHFQSQPPAGCRTSHRRASLANWLTDRKSVASHLLARVIANRLWQHHLGRGIVASPSDFGTRGDLPSHPELLDWMASELIRHEWSLKCLHRQIVNSSTYQQSCESDEARSSIDRENKLFWHRSRRRLDAEVLRDSILAVSGELDDRMHGPGQLDENHRRRSIYFTIKRSRLMPSMTVFDAPDGTTPIADRPQTTIAPQALVLLNNPHVREAARQFARTLTVLAADSPETAVSHAYMAAISRSPTTNELTDTLAFFHRYSRSDANDDARSNFHSALADFCQVLFCLNEFVFSE